MKMMDMLMDILPVNGEWLVTMSSFLGGGALGGWISAVVNRKENKRIKQSEAFQSEASAKREDALAATEMMGLLERTVAHMEKMNSYNKSNSEELLRLLREKEGINEKLKKDLSLLQLQITEDHRRITGLEKTVEREIRWRKDGDDHYCLVVDCPNRLPPRGTFKRVEEQQ
jgi:predicted RNase H-like nuclease (RuvC/YqgF family)